MELAHRVLGNIQRSPIAPWDFLLPLSAPGLGSSNPSLVSRNPFGSRPLFLLSFSVGPAADSCGGSRASPCWGGRQAQAGDSWGQRTSMAFRCLDGPPPLAGRVGAANVLTRLTGHCHSAASVPGLLTSGQGWPCIAEDCGELPGTEASCAVLILSYVDWTFYMLDKRSSREPHPKPLWYLVFLLSFRFFFSVLCA